MMGYVRYYLKRGLYYLTLPFRFIFRFPTYVVSAPRAIWGLSLPARVAAILAVFLPLLTLLAIWGFQTDTLGTTLGNWWSEHTGNFVMSVLLAITLWIAIPVVAYFATKAWLTPELSDFPEIDDAFNKGLEKLRENGVDLASVPLILALGAASRSEMEAVFNGAGFEYVTDGEPKGQKELVWYARKDAVFLATVGLGCLGGLQEEAAGVTPGSSLSESGTRPPQDAIGGNTIVADVDYSSSEDDSATPGSLKGGDVAYGGTIVAGGGIGGTLNADALKRSAPPKEVNWDRNKETEQRSRLQHLLSLVGRERQPLCWLNGIVLLVGWKGLQTKTVSDKLDGAVRSDMLVSQQKTGLRLPAAVLIHGLHTEEGFIELVRRVGEKEAKRSRFGKGFYGIEAIAEKPVVAAYADQACSAFESWVYALFKRPEALNLLQGNSRLYLLLGKVRTVLQARIRKLLTDGLGYRDGDSLSPVPFIGCYFAASGPRSDRQAFIGSVLEKVVDNQAEIEWTPTAFNQDARYHVIAQVAMAISGLLLVTMIVAIVWVNTQT